MVRGKKRRVNRMVIDPLPSMVGVESVFEMGGTVAKISGMFFIPKNMPLIFTENELVCLLVHALFVYNGLYL